MGETPEGNHSRSAAVLQPRNSRYGRIDTMLYWAVVFFIVAIVAGVFGFGGISAAATDIAQILFFVFIVLFVLSLIFGYRGRRPPV
jgi:uncharacterized membrane protein YtjA (UPF0391 family)